MDTPILTENYANTIPQTHHSAVCQTPAETYPNAAAHAVLPFDRSKAIKCGCCGQVGAPGGFRLKVIEVCNPCRDDRAAEVANNRFNRREARRKAA